MHPATVEPDFSGSHPMPQIQSKSLSITGVNICPKKSETVFPGIRGILKLSVLVNKKIFKTVYWNIKSRFFGQCWGISSTLKNCLFYISFDLKCRRAPTHIFSHLFGPKLSITSKNFWNCLQVCLGSETVCPEKDRQTAFYSPLCATHGHLFLGHLHINWLYTWQAICWTKGRLTENAKDPHRIKQEKKNANTTHLHFFKELLQWRPLQHN